MTGRTPSEPPLRVSESPRHREGPLETRDLATYASFLCLVYHEARNVRHLIKEGVLESPPYEWLRSLPHNRKAAWADLQGLRKQASQSRSAKLASEVFASRFQLTLEDLVEMYTNDGWRHSAYGGNRWAGITRSVIELGDTLDRGDAARAGDLLGRIPTMSHNTGQVGDKLGSLDTSL